MGPGKKLEFKQFSSGDYTQVSPPRLTEKRHKSERRNPHQHQQQVSPNIYAISRPSQIPLPVNQDYLRDGRKFGRTKRDALSFVPSKDDVDPPKEMEYFKINKPQQVPFLDMDK